MSDLIDNKKIDQAVSFGSDLSLDLTLLPGQIWFWGAQEATALELSLTAKADLEQKHAELYTRYRETAAKAAEKTTEASIDAKIELDPEYRRYTEKLIRAEGHLRQCKAAVEALRKKSDMAVQLSYNHRAQIQASLEPAPSPRRNG